MIPLVTIGLLTYNNENTIIRALEGLVHQTYANKELVIFDDQSKDNTWFILAQYAKKYPFIKLYKNLQNIGVMRNFDQLLHEIKGEYFWWACPDDNYSIHFIEKCLAVFNTSPTLVSVLSSVQIFFENNNMNIPSEKADYQIVDFDFYIKNKREIKDRVVLRKNLEQYCLYIHSLMKSAVIRGFIPFSGHYLSIEELFAAFFIVRGGIGTIQEVLWEKHQDLTPLQNRNMEAYKIAYGLKNKLLCLLVWLKLVCKAPIGLKPNWEFLLILLLLLKKYTFDSLLNGILEEVSLFKRFFLKKIR